MQDISTSEIGSIVTLSDQTFDEIIRLCGEQNFKELWPLLQQFDFKSRKIPENELRLIPLSYAFKAGRAVVESLLDQGADINAVDDLGWTPLLTASGTNYADIVELLLKRGADMNITSNYGLIPLVEASIKGRTEVIKLLLEYGADPSGSITRSGLTAIHLACYHGHIDIVRILLDCGVDVNINDRLKKTPLIKATEEIHYDVVKLLLERGATVNIRDDEGYTPLGQSCSYYDDDYSIFMLLIEYGADIHMKYINDSTPLHIACRKGNIEIVRYLLDHGADLTCRNKDGSTPWHYASLHRNPNMIRFLLQYSGLSEEKDTLGNTPFMAACTNSLTTVESIDMLIQAGADIHARNNNGYTTLMFASSKSNIVEVFDLLIKSGIDINASTTYGDTALILASRKGCAKSIQRLLEEDTIDIHTQNNQGYDALAVACSPTYMHHNYDYVTPIKYLLHNGANIYRFYGDMKYTILHIAIKHNAVPVIKYLIEETGIDINTQDIDGNTALHLYVSSDNRTKIDISIIKLLVNYHADTRLKNNCGHTPLMVITLYSKRLDEDIINLLTPQETMILK